VIRTGELNNSSLVARPLGRFRWVTCASPDYLQGIWRAAVTGGALSAPGCALFLRQARRADEFRFVRHGETFSVPVSGNAAVNETGLYIKMCLAGFGLAQLAENIVADHLQEGRLVEVLTDWQPPRVPVTLLYPHQRFLSPPCGRLLSG
jgi:LysR family transcriptional regulator for bpeEF and oprC